MESVKKVCRFCYKDFTTQRKQQRYCSLNCSHRGKNKMAFNHWIDNLRNKDQKQNAEGIQVTRWRPDSEVAGLCLERERYQE